MTNLYIGRKVYQGDIWGISGVVVAVQGGWYQVAWEDGTTVWHAPGDGTDVYAPSR